MINMMFDWSYLNLILFVCVVILSMGIIFMSVKGLLGFRLKKILSVSTIGEFFMCLVMVVAIIMFIINLILIFTNYFISLGHLNVFFCVIDENSKAADPDRFWPSGITQTWGVIGTAAALYRTTPGTHKMKTFAALGSMAITIPMNVYLHAVEHPNGFNKVMYSWVYYKNTGTWPPAGAIPNSDMVAAMDVAINNKNIAEVASSVFVNNTTAFLPTDTNDLLSYIKPENLFLNLIGFFKPVGVEGHLDDLLGQQLIIYFLLISVVIGIIILFFVYFFIQILFNNKDFLTNRFNNKIIRFYIKYQIVLSKISLFVLPLFILLGLFELLFGLYFLITHPIPYEELPIDLHTFLKKKE